MPEALAGAPAVLNFLKLTGDGSHVVCISQSREASCKCFQHVGQFPSTISEKRERESFA